MLRTLSDPGSAAIVDRHRRYWHNETAAGDLPLLAFRPARPMDGTGESRPVTPPAPVDGDAFRDATVRRYA